MATSFSLPNKKVTLLPIVRKKTYMGVENHDGAFLFTGAFQAWSIFRNQYGQYIDPLNKAERDYFEKLYKENFNPDIPGNFWEKFEVKIKKDTADMNLLKREFNLSNPKDYLAYKLLLTAPDVANTWEERKDTPEYRWVLVEKEEKVQDVLSKGAKKAKCYEWLMSNSNKPSTLKDVLYVLNKTLTFDMSKDEIKATIIDIIEDDKLLNQLYEAITDENLEGRILIAKGLKTRQIRYNKGKYFLFDGTEIGAGRKQVLEWLGNPENQEKILILKKNIQKAKI